MSRQTLLARAPMAGGGFDPGARLALLKQSSRAHAAFLLQADALGAIAGPEKVAPGALATNNFDEPK